MAGVRTTSLKTDNQRGHTPSDHNPLIYIIVGVLLCVSIGTMFQFLSRSGNNNRRRRRYHLTAEEIEDLRIQREKRLEGKIRSRMDTLEKFLNATRMRRATIESKAEAKRLIKKRMDEWDVKGQTVYGDEWNDSMKEVFSLPQEEFWELKMMACQRIRQKEAEAISTERIARETARERYLDMATAREKHPEERAAHHQYLEEGLLTTTAATAMPRKVVVGNDDYNMPMTPILENKRSSLSGGSYYQKRKNTVKSNRDNDENQQSTTTDSLVVKNGPTPLVLPQRSDGSSASDTENDCVSPPLAPSPVLLHEYLHANQVRQTIQRKSFHNNGRNLSATKDTFDDSPLIDSSICQTVCHMNKNNDPSGIRELNSQGVNNLVTSLKDSLCTNDAETEQTEIMPRSKEHASTPTTEKAYLPKLTEQQKAVLKSIKRAVKERKDCC